MFLMVKTKIICFWQSEPKVKRKWKRKRESKEKNNTFFIWYHFFHMMSKVPTINMTFTVDVNLYLSAYWVFVRILYSKVLSSPIYFGRKSLCGPHFKSAKLCFTSQKGLYLYKLFGIFLHGLFVYPPPFIYVSIVYSHQWETCIVILYFGLSSTVTLFTLFFKLLYLWPSGGFPLKPLSILHTFSIVCVYFSTY